MDMDKFLLYYCKASESIDEVIVPFCIEEKVLPTHVEIDKENNRFIIEYEKYKGE